MREGEEIRKAARAYAMAKSNGNNTFLVGYKDIEKAFLNGALFVYTYSEKVTTNKRRIEHGSDN